ncbi:hypothetical protein EON63_25285 [archaeon]|nr:MAG: hypothetical protein EON63_25285 [archaeon]
MRTYFILSMHTHLHTHTPTQTHTESWHPVELSVLSGMLGQLCIQKFYLSSVAGLNYDITLTNR